MEELDDLKFQIEQITIKEPCSPAELKLANAVCVLISIVKHELSLRKSRD